MKGGREDVKVGERKDSKRETERKGNMERRVRERMITGPVVMCRVMHATPAFPFRVGSLSRW